MTPVRVQTWHLSPLRWPRGQRLRIVMVADIHACNPWMPLHRVEQIIDQANRLDGDLIVLMGDYPGHILAGRALPADIVAQSLTALTAPLGVYAVFGNHDWKDDKPAKTARLAETTWHKAFDKAGIATLNNAHSVINAKPGQICLAGVDSQRAYLRRFKKPIEGAHNLDQALDGADTEMFTILLAHEPDIFPDLPASVDLTLSGHTHGGQILVFGRPVVVPSIYGATYAYGHTHAEGRDLVVSGGLGCSGLPIRIGVPPELTVVELS